MAALHPSHQAQESLFTTLGHILRTFFMKLEQTEIAIVLSEAGDIEGAKALIGKHAK
jgi:hypothetical protein